MWGVRMSVWLPGLLGLVAGACSRAEPVATTTPTPSAGSAAVAVIRPDGAAVVADAAVGSGDSAIAAVATPTRAVPSGHPSADVIAFRCAHSNMPWGDGSQSRSDVYDLIAATVTRETSDTPNSPRDAPRSAPAPTVTHVVAPIEPARLAQIRGALTALAAGGPYEPEYPVSEGVACTLSIAAAGGAPWFSIEKANRLRQDAVTALLQALP